MTGQQERFWPWNIDASASNNTEMKGGKIKAQEL
jgi:hypothetical protein